MTTRTTSQKSRDLIDISVKRFIDDYVYRIDLDADYQREKIWSRSDQERLLDSIIQNIDIPKIYLAKVEDNENFDYECIDGKQRMTTLLSFIKPEPSESKPLTVRVAGDKYTYETLREEIPKLAKRIDDFKLTFVIYPANLDEEFIREVFRRLQLGIRLNSGELLKSQTGTMRDFVYEEMGTNAPFLGKTNLSEKRFSRQFTLAQICINSFSRFESEEFVRARYDDLEDFFKEKYDLKKSDQNLERIRTVLKLMDKRFGTDAFVISSRAVAVSAYLFSEKLFLDDKSELVESFAKFFVKLLDDIKENLDLLSKFQPPSNPTILEDFQKYITQASVEPYSIKRRDRFLAEAFSHYQKTKGRIIGN